MHQLSSPIIQASMLLALAQPIAAQGLAERIAAVRQGDVELHYASRPGVCGDGSQQLSIGGSTFMGDGLYTSHDGGASWQLSGLPDSGAFGRIVVNSTFTFSLMVGISVADTTLGTLIANLGYAKVTTPKPVFLGDTLRIETDVMDKRESKSRPNAGIVTFRHRAFNQRDEIVCEAFRTALLKRGEA